MNEINLDAIITPLQEAGIEGVTARQYSKLLRNAGINARHMQPIPPALVARGVFFRKTGLREYRYFIALRCALAKHSVTA